MRKYLTAAAIGLVISLLIIVLSEANVEDVLKQLSTANGYSHPNDSDRQFLKTIGETITSSGYRWGESKFARADKLYAKASYLFLVKELLNKSAYYCPISIMFSIVLTGTISTVQKQASPELKKIVNTAIWLFAGAGLSFFLVAYGYLLASYAGFAIDASPSDIDRAAWCLYMHRCLGQSIFWGFIFAPMGASMGYFMGRGKTLDSGGSNV
jgi:hypothetical protein